MSWSLMKFFRGEEQEPAPAAATATAEPTVPCHLDDEWFNQYYYDVIAHGGGIDPDDYQSMAEVMLSTSQFVDERILEYSVDRADKSFYMSYRSKVETSPLGHLPSYRASLLAEWNEQYIQVLDRDLMKAAEKLKIEALRNGGHIRLHMRNDCNHGDDRVWIGRTAYCASRKHEIITMED